MIPTVLVPLRPFGSGKTRLSEVLDPATRARLSERWAVRALSAAREAFPGRTPVVIGAPSLADFARREGANFLDEGPLRGLAVQLERAVDALASDGERRLLVLMGDLPDVDANALRELAILDADVALAESESGRGTNALCIGAPRRFGFAFGDPESAALHEAAAVAAGLTVVRTRLTPLLRDVDVPGDLRGSDHA